MFASERSHHLARGHPESRWSWEWWGRGGVERPGLGAPYFTPICVDTVIGLSAGGCLKSSQSEYLPKISSSKILDEEHLGL